MGCGCSSLTGEMPMNPTSSVTATSFSSVTARPASSVTGRSVSSGVTARVVSAPSRSTTTSSVSPGASRMIADASSKLATGVPSIETISSPGSIPASAAGATGSADVHSAPADDAGTTHSDTAATVVVAVDNPMPEANRANRTIASSRFMTGPPSMMITRLNTGSR